MRMSPPAPGVVPFSTNLSAGSTVNVQISRKVFFASRLLTVMRTGRAGAGNRSDSLNVRFMLLASAVVSHSP